MPIRLSVYSEYNYVYTIQGVCIFMNITMYIGCMYIHEYKYVYSVCVYSEYNYVYSVSEYSDITMYTGWPYIHEYNYVYRVFVYS